MEIQVECSHVIYAVVLKKLYLLLYTPSNSNDSNKRFIKTLNTAIHTIRRPHPSMLVLHITILNRSQRIKQFQKTLANLAVAKLDLHVSVGNTLDWLRISIFRCKKEEVQLSRRRFHRQRLRRI